MPPPKLKDDFSKLRSDMQDSMLEGLKRRYGLPAPLSSSDWQACLEPIFLLYDIKRRPIPLERKDIYESHSDK